MNLTTTTQAKVFIQAGGQPKGTDDDAHIGYLVRFWSKRAERFMDRDATTATYTEYFDVEPGQWQFSLKAYPVNSMASVINDPSWAYTTGTVGTASKTYDPATGMLSLQYYPPAPGVRALKVTYAGGMGTSAASFAANYPDIADAVAQQVAYAWQRRKDMGKESLTDQMGSRSYRGALTWLPHVRETLMQHRRYTFG